MRILFVFSVLLISQWSLANMNSDAPVCVAVKKQEIHYGSSMWHEVVCSNGDRIRAGSILTAFLIPLPPFNWTEQSYNKMILEMNELDFVPVGQISVPPKGWRWTQYSSFDDMLIHIFSTDPVESLDVFCVANPRESSVETDVEGREVLKYDVSFKCSDGSSIELEEKIEKRHLAEVTQKLGLLPVLTTSVLSQWPVELYRLQ